MGEAPLEEKLEEGLGLRSAEDVVTMDSGWLEAAEV